MTNLGFSEFKLLHVHLYELFMQILISLDADWFKISINCMPIFDNENLSFQ